MSSKGQLISKCLFGVIAWQDRNSNRNIVRISALKVFMAFLGLWNLFGASCRLPCLLYCLLSPPVSPKKTSRKPQGSTKTKFAVQKLFSIFGLVMFFQLKTDTAFGLKIHLSQTLPQYTPVWCTPSY